MRRICFLVVVLFEILANAVKIRDQASKSGSAKRWTYTPESHLNEMYTKYLQSRGGKASGKSGSAKTGEKAETNLLDSCCQVCPYKFHSQLVFLELPEDVHRKTLERFRDWHMNLLEKQQEKQQNSREEVRLGAGAPDCLDPKYTGRPKPVYRKISKKGMPGYPGIWECPYVKENDDAKTVCCNMCPDQKYPPLDIDIATGAMTYNIPKLPKLPKECSKINVHKKCSKEGFKAGTSCDRSMVTCPKAPTSFPGVDAPCCNLCPEDFKPEEPDPSIPNKKPKSFMADENGFVLPSLTPKASKEVNRCCYLCASADYNGSPGDSPFNEPQSASERAHNLMLPMAIPDKNYRNRRDYATKAGGK